MHVGLGFADSWELAICRQVSWSGQLFQTCPDSEVKPKIPKTLTSHCLHLKNQYARTARGRIRPHTARNWANIGAANAFRGGRAGGRRRKRRVVGLSSRAASAAMDMRLLRLGAAPVAACGRREKRGRGRPSRGGVARISGRSLHTDLGIGRASVQLALFDGAGPELERILSSNAY